MLESRKNEIKRILMNGPTESLDLEIKDWLDVSTPHGKAKIAKACLALRNNDGGCLVIGFNDRGEQSNANRPSNIRVAYVPDKIQELIGRYASEPFGVDVDYVEINGVEHPILEVPSGIKSPLICKSDLADTSGPPLLKDNVIYVRSLSSNGRVSSSEIRRADWERLFTICFDNREANVAQFVRRHLSDIFDPAAVRIAALYGEQSKVSGILDQGYDRFRELCVNKALTLPTPLGYREFAAEIKGTNHQTMAVPNVSLMQAIAGNTPRLSGWTPWVILNSAQNESMRPFVREGRLEAFLDNLGGGWSGHHLDYWSLAPKGELYQIRALEDDLINHTRGYEAVVPGRCLDFLLQISRVCEGIWVAISIAQTLGFGENSTVHFASRWRGLRGRNLLCWVDRSRSFASWGSSVTDDFTHQVTFQLNATKGDMFTIIRPIIANLFSQFGGTEIDDGVLRSIISQTLDRNL